MQYNSNPEITKMPNEQLDSKHWHKAIIGNVSCNEISDQIMHRDTPEWVKPILELTKTGDSVIELGCGTGTLSGVLAKKGRSVTLIDYSPDTIDFCKNVFGCAGLEASFLVADVLKTLSLKENSFDCVWSCGLLEHFSDENIVNILKESKRISRKYVVSLVPNAYSCTYRIGKWYQEKHGIWPWGYEDPKKSLSRLFEVSGLKKINEFTVDIKKSNSFLYPIKPFIFSSIAVKLLNMIPSILLKPFRQGYLLVTVGKK
ncbi:MAG: class I SAM-dependent methyltransferase [Elusimicrobia bacterium]|nr:class I SAM-dependent methyltransferase [Candidatus Liberimonas magnetica]